MGGWVGGGQGEWAGDAIEADALAASVRNHSARVAGSTHPPTHPAAPVSGDTRFCNALTRSAGLMRCAALAETVDLLLPMSQSLNRNWRERLLFSITSSSVTVSSPSAPGVGAQGGGAVVSASACSIPAWTKFGRVTRARTQRRGAGTPHRTTRPSEQRFSKTRSLARRRPPAHAEA